MSDNYKEWQDSGELIALGFRLLPDENGEFNPLVYERMSQFCNENGYDIKDCRPDYFEITEAAAISAEVLAVGVRLVRDGYMNMILAKADRYEKQTAAALPTTDSAETYRQYLHYLEYLRKIPEAEDFPRVEVLDFESWKAKEND